jgi:hypothetical protein
VARGFGATYGTTTTDKIVSGLTAHATLRTYSIWVFRNGNGGGNLGRMVDKRTGADGHTEMLNFEIVAVAYQYSRQWSGGEGRWAFSAPATGEWHQFSVSYDGGAAANDPVMYLDGASQSLVTDINQSGSLNTSGSNYVIGNRGNDDARNWDGQLAEFAVWDRILSAAEHAALGKGFSPLHFRQSLILYVPMIRESVDYYSTVPTVTGALVQPHIRVIFPVAIGFAPPGSIITKEVVDGFVLADARSNEAGPAKSDSVAMADARTFIPGKITTDAATIADAIATGVGKLMADVLTMADARALQAGKVVTDSFSLADAFSAALVLIKDLVDSITVADARSMQAGKTAVDPVALADALTSGVSKAAVDALTLADAKVMQPGKVATDSFTIADVVALSLLLLKAVQDAITVTDTISKMAGKVTTDAATLADAKIVSVGKLAADLLSIADAVGKMPAKSFADNVVLADAVSALIGVIAAILLDLSKKPSAVQGGKFTVEKVRSAGQE